MKQCAELGADILDSAAAALAPGGELVYSTCTFAPEEDEGQVAAFLQRHPEFTLADVLGNVDYLFGSEGEANRTGGLPLDVSKVRRIWPCQGGEGHFMARLVKAGTPRTLPAPGEYTPKSSSGWPLPPRQAKRPRAANHRRLQSLRMPAAPGGRTAGLAERLCRAAVPAAGTLGQGMHRPPRASLHGGNLRRNISRSWQSALPWYMAAAFCCRRLSRRRIFTFCVQASSWAVCKRDASCRNIICSRLSARSARTVRN